MPTSFSAVYETFFKKMEADPIFFNYFDKTEEESMEIATERAHDYLIESCVRLSTECSTDVDFMDYDEEQEVFNFELTKIEIDLLAWLMYEANYSREYSRQKVFERDFVPQDLQVFSPSQNRKTFRQLYQDIRSQNLTRLDNYQSRERIGHAAKVIDYATYDAEDE